MTSTVGRSQLSAFKTTDHPIPDPEIILFAAITRESLMAPSRFDTVR